MDYLEAMRAGFLDELEKIGGWARKGSVPIHAQTVVDNHNKGKLLLRALKKTKDAKKIKKEAGVLRVPRREHFEGAIEMPMRLREEFHPASALERVIAGFMGEKRAEFYAPAVPYSAGEPNIPMPLSAAKKKRGDVPSKEDMDAIPKREDGRESATTVHSPSQSGSNISVSLSPTGEHS